MKSRPMIFNGAMVRALLDGSKTQTRRVVKSQPPERHAFAGWCMSSTHSEDEGKATWAIGEGPLLRDSHRVRCPHGQPGDRLWVRETFMDLTGTGVEHRDNSGTMQRFAYAADCPPGSYGDAARKDYDLKWRPSIHMPHTASRIMLEIVSVRVERLTDISEADARAEGITDGGCTNCGESEPCNCAHPKPDARDAFIFMWESINGAASWFANPWVWAIEFKRIKNEH